MTDRSPRPRKEPGRVVDVIRNACPNIGMFCIAIPTPKPCRHKIKRGISGKAISDFCKVAQGVPFAGRAPYVQEGMSTR